MRVSQRRRPTPTRHDQRGASLVEYLLGVGFIVIVAIGGITYFGTRVADSVSASGSDIVEAGEEIGSCEAALEGGSGVGVVVPPAGEPYGLVLNDDSTTAACEFSGDAPSYGDLLSSCGAANAGDELMVVVYGETLALGYRAAGSETWTSCPPPSPSEI